ncbi:MAG TPA: carbonic anhydrase, partial [Nitrospiria bacterium]
VFVLGHERCGAVSAAVEVVTKGAKVPGHIGSLVKAIKPAVDKVKGKTGDIVDNAVRANVSLVASQLAGSKPILAELVKTGKIKIAGGRYDLDQGKVELV